MPYFSFLAKKVAIPNNTKLRTVSWNPEHGWLVCGGEDGLLKVLKLDAGGSDGARGVAAQTSLAMNQTLEGHKSAVAVTSWNAPFRKLTTSDESGLIIVWVLHKGVWYEEMINNRNKSVVRDMRWRGNGSEICIAYDDGMVIVGNVDGNRLWSKDMGTRLSLLEWAPDGSVLLFATADGPIAVHNHQGVRVGALSLAILADILPPGADPGTALLPPSARVVAMEWYDGAEGYSLPDCPTLCIALVNGRVQLQRACEDDAPVCIDTQLSPLVTAKWNSNGSVLAVVGQRPAGAAGGRDTSEVQFYTPMGRFLSALKVPGGNVSSLAWEGGGLRAALAVDSFVYFANVRPEYKWAAFGDGAIVYAFTKPEKAEQCVVFWNTRSDERYIKYVKNLITIAAAGDSCVLVTSADADASASSATVVPGAPSTSSSSGIASGQFVLILCDAIGSPVDTKYISVSPEYVCMTPSHVLVASASTLYLWQYARSAPVKGGAGGGAGGGSSTVSGGGASLDGGVGGGLGVIGGVSSSTTAALRGARKEAVGKERIFHVDDVNTGGGGGDSGGVGSGRGGATAGSFAADAICCVAASSRCLLVGRESGLVQQYSLPGVTLENRFTLRCRPAHLQLNCDGTRFAIIDSACVLSFFDLEARGHTPAGVPTVGEHLPFERKDVWSLMWAEDYPDLWAIMERTRMYVFRGQDPEEPVLSSGYLARFKDLTITSVLLDDAMAAPDAPSKATMVVQHEARSLRDTRTLLAKNTLRDCIAFVEDKAHPRLWHILAETALERLDLGVAEKAYVACSDYPGIQFVKRLRLLGDKYKQKAEVAASLARFDEAVSIYRTADRADLAVELRMRVGDWKHVLHLLQNGGGGGDDELVKLAQNRLGDYYADRQQWAAALPLYEAANNYEALVECCYIVEDYTALAALIEVLPEGSPLLRSVGTKLQSVGITEPAARALLKAGDFKAAVDACVLLNQWDRAVEIAEAHKLPQIEGLLQKYAGRLLEEGATIAAVELYRKAGREAESARLLAKLASEVGALRTHPVRAKQLFVLAALDVERHRRRVIDLSAAAAAAAGAGTTGGGGTLGGATSAALTGLMGGTTKGGGTAAVLDTMLREDAADVTSYGGARTGTGGGTTSMGGTSSAARTAARTLDAAWHGAEGFHFLLVAQRLLYAGDTGAAMAAALRLTLYEDVLDPRDVYSLVALTAYYNRCFGTASRAFVKLENLETLSVEARAGFADLAMSIFSRTRPQDPLDDASTSVVCPGKDCRAVTKAWAVKCTMCGLAFAACVASGRPIIASGAGAPECVRCNVCKHKAFVSAQGDRTSCCLCNAELPKRT